MIGHASGIYCIPKVVVEKLLTECNPVLLSGVITTPLA